MPVELRKRKAPAAPPPPPAAKRQSKASKVATKVKEAVTGKPADTPAAKAGGPPAVGSQIDLEGFGGEIETNDGTKTTLKALVEQSKSGVVLFTYPKASTPGCTTQACLFRDSYEPLTSGGLAIYGLSKDSPKANTTFKEKQKLPYPLLCDPSATLIAAIGLKKQPSGTQRGVFAVDKSGKVLLSQPGGPAPTVNAVKALVESSATTAESEPAAATVPDEKEGKDEKEAAPAAVNGEAAKEAKEE
ncbi:thioredoxin-like protein [Microdochium bolleyi]|uniref:thioredoxin-dependent peroxiredoxin n=1 Tax=Microdochium bolleyi TaxID=196109 RepID=A0A136J1G1_9PEZI|nr:thioredoxin-like protein [Microdochium bolleyi]